MCMHAMNHQGQHRDESLLEIIRRRYAVGEITRDQFEQLTRDLGLDGQVREAGGHEAHGHNAVP